MVQLSGPRRDPSLEGESSDTPYLNVVNLLLRHRRSIAAFSLTGAILFGAFSLFSERVYTAEASLLPQGSPSTPSRLYGLAAQMGINVGTPDLGQSPAFYGALLETREILQPTVETRYTFRARNASISGTLVDLLHAKGASPSERLESAINDLERRITVNVYPQTGLVQLKVATPWAALSYQVAERILALVNEFNIARRQSQGKAEAAFAQQLLDQSRTDLRLAENQLQEFLQRNRLWQSDPQLVFEHDRLQRAVDMRQDVYTSLFQSLQQARIDAVRDTPPMTVVEQPYIPARPDSKGVPMRALLGLIIGALFAVALGFAGDSLARDKTSTSPVSGQYSVLRTAAIRDLRRVFRLKVKTD